ncbi:hypothetical protein PPL_00253 [Heterostelium album PN500]|uniref:Uncharacterized protein n=1 Tax=Heterostelium pallidum (strain ATCC 26659 / Pp 5 / PN500) TaxID=670386 RepID=D3AVY7_HETP5|nr:hypothetical protein PPL_00253 [Heterostelium album PN500]EFA86460.1 hypothetical protein PPL_00253 [Heterostelium album PN500]|eukprot:XP_020438565.1 hypothetical protein PPL_00253 [Heterostelium album PN500]
MYEDNKENFDEESQLVSKSLVFDDRNSLSNFIRIYTLYRRFINWVDDEDVDNDYMRSKCVKFFVDFYVDKYIHYTDNNGYTKFIVEVFYERSLNVFNHMMKFKCATYRPVIKDIYNRIINDKRFKEWFNKLNQSDIDQLKHRIDTYFRICYFGEIESISNFNYEYLYKLANENDNEVNNSNSNIINDNNQLSSLTISLTDQQHQLSDIILEMIISFTLNVKHTHCTDRYHFNETLQTPLYGSEIVTLSLVSKRFFKIISKHLDKNYYLWSNYFNAGNEFCLIKQSPLFFDYDSIKYLRYDRGIKYVDNLLSRVETFFIQSDEKDSTLESNGSKAYLYDYAEANGMQYRKISRFNYLDYKLIPKVKQLTNCRFKLTPIDNILNGIKKISWNEKDEQVYQYLVNLNVVYAEAEEGEWIQNEEQIVQRLSTEELREERWDLKAKIMQEKIKTFRIMLSIMKSKNLLPKSVSKLALTGEPEAGIAIDSIFGLGIWEWLFGGGRGETTFDENGFSGGFRAPGHGGGLLSGIWGASNPYAQSTSQLAAYTAITTPQTIATIATLTGVYTIRPTLNPTQVATIFAPTNPGTINGIDSRTAAPTASPIGGTGTRTFNGVGGIQLGSPILDAGQQY